MTRLISLLCCAGALLCGCSGDRTTPELQATPAVEAAPAAAAPAAAQAAEAPAAPAEKVREAARVGVGAKGNDLDPGLLTTPVKTYFTAQELIAFDVQVPQALQLFKATNGRSPESEDEFMQQVIKANNIELPTLPAGHRYVYDVASEQLMVEHPK
ncbi:MAG: hypothetical protein K1X74_16520 [Pirellulales bacterium]|nr:hypothetical protein [Pirellulales bacterium]